MIQAKNFFLVRQPLYSLDKMANFYQALNKESLEHLLQQHYQDPLAQQAILLASPGLFDRFKRWQSGEAVSDKQKLLTTLHKYFIRSCSRPTPYGLFAGCMVGHFGENSQWRAGAVEDISIHSRLDMNYLLALCQWISEQPEVRNQFLLRTNSSLYSVGDSFRYVEQQRDSEQRNYFISAVESDQHLFDILQLAAKGATIDQLALVLTAKKIEESAAKEYIEQLIQCQLLCFDIEPKLTESGHLDKLITLVDSLENTHDLGQKLRALRQASIEPNPITAYTGINQWFSGQSISTDGPDLIQVDLSYKNRTLQLGERPLRTLKSNLEKLMVLNQPVINNDLEEFKRRFSTRYEEEEVPLSLALDSEFGVGYGTASTLGVGYAPLVDDLTLSVNSANETTVWNWWQSFVLDKYTQSLLATRPNNTIDEVILTDEDLAYIAENQDNTPPLPSSFSVLGTFLAMNQKALDNNEFLFNLLACKGPSSLNLISRFGEADPALAGYIRSCAAAEEVIHSDVILAEIVHFPEHRAGNILNRPTTYQYELPYMGQASVPSDHQLPLSDLFVSVRNNKVVIRSKHHNQRVIPRLTTAHNYTQGLPIYRFLCDLQAQDAQLSIGWNWGVLRNQPYLPRVRHNNIIVSRASWLLSCATLNPDNLLRLVAQLTAAGLPDQFVIAQGDNELYISKHIPESLDLLAQEIRRQKSDDPNRSHSSKPGHIKLVEFLSTPEQSPLNRKGERFNCEVIIPFDNTSATPLPDLSMFGGTSIQRKFSVGSEWFYMKIYIGESTSDRLLTDVIHPVVHTLLENRIVDEFFFVRFTDSDPHLRLRFKGNAHLEFYHHVVRVMEKSLREAIESGIVHRVQVDTYQRELERYGVESMEICERLFYLDSLATLNFLTQIKDELDETLKIAAAIKKIHQVLVGASFSPDDCLTALRNLKEAFFREFGATPKLQRQLNAKYRAYNQLIDQAVAGDFPFAGIVATYQDQQIGLLEQLVHKHTNRPRLFDIIRSLVHMVVNRLFSSKQRAYELVLYHCLTKYYDSVRARQQVQLR